ncbi:response regulator [Paenibacillus rhizovicinus]|uniref:Response regulator n=1 Tax=Paenibacillus rhizovicinus TaxID=2704463 RepID=A0A6C0NX43_9BACL|nr:response regulator [Paenibacillus rhizovicinus]QHW30805.1 response regulator [Paenibacillus rhizovicinus]
MKLMIVDDEQLMRQGIRKKIQMTGLPVTVVAEAGDGEEALHKLAEERPDIVITDIRMPRMDGLAFLEEAQRAMPELQFVVVSGYGEFEYARRAIQFGVTDYLLKPVDKEELKESLARIIRKIEWGRSQRELSAQAEQWRSSSEASLRDQMLSKLIQYGEDGGQSAAARDERLLGMIARCSHFAAVVFQLEPIVLPHQSFRKEDEKLLRFAVHNIIATILDSSGRDGVLFRHVMHENELVYVLGGHSPVETEALQRELNEILDGIRRHLKLEAAIGCGAAVNRMEVIQQSYQQAKQALRNRIFYGVGRVYMAETEYVKAEPHSVISREDESYLLSCLNECNAGALDAWIAQRVEAVATGARVYFTHLESFCVEFHLLMRKYLLTQTSIPEWIIGELDDLLHWLQALENWRKIPGQLTEMVHNIIGHLYKLRHASEYSAIDEVKRYIDQSLHEPLNLQMIAERFFFHPSYFSRRFKERFGENFVNYLTNERIRKSEALLRDPNLKIQQVAELVGFKDAAYFSSVFRKATGMTPNQFRSRSASAESPEAAT